jgi:glycosyltransferase involved in cell wall biosynthesis
MATDPSLEFAARASFEEGDQIVKNHHGTPMKVLHVGKFMPPPYAGIESHIEQLLPLLQPDVDTGLLVSELGWHHRDSAHRPFAVHAARTLATFASTAISPGMPMILRKLVREHGYQIVHLHLPNPMADFASRWLPSDIPIVLTWHSDIVKQRRLLRLYWPMLQRLLERAERIIVFTPKHIESSKQLKTIADLSKLRVIPVAIDARRFERTLKVDAAMLEWRQRLGTRPLVLTVGRHVYYKGYQFLIDAMTTLKSNASLVMVGTGPLTEQLRASANSLGLGDRVHMLGSLADIDVVALMHLCDVFCQPSVEPSEAFGLSSAEAMLCGKPVVVCELGNGVNYLNQNEKTGLTVSPRDSKALAAALDRLLGDADFSADMGRGAREWVNAQFSTHKMRDGTLNLYREILNDRV